MARQDDLTVPATVESLRPEHWPEVRSIYEAGIATGNATFETAAPSWDAWTADHLELHRFVAMRAGQVVGWVAASPVSSRCVYTGVIEHGVYVHPDARGHGVGRVLLKALIASSEADGIWTIETGVFPENASSLAVHARCGFRTVGYRERVGQLDGHWRDALLLEHRSPLVI
jgi:L-amino acid N-acyltransferase YncA